MAIPKQAAQSIHFATAYRQAGMGQGTRLAASMVAKGQGMQASDIYRDVLAKAESGAGSRGGSVLGRTRSGKIIYAHRVSTHASYRGMSSVDHKQAAAFHDKAASTLQGQAKASANNSLTGKQRESARQKMDHHSRAAEGHRNIAATF